MKKTLGAFSLTTALLLGACGQQSGSMKVELEEATAKLTANKPLISRPAAPSTGSTASAATARGVIRATDTINIHQNEFYYDLFQEAFELFRYQVNAVVGIRVLPQGYFDFWSWNFPWQTQQFPSNFNPGTTVQFQFYTQSNERTYRRYGYGLQSWQRDSAMLQTLGYGVIDGGQEAQAIFALGGAAGAARTLTIQAAAISNLYGASQSQSYQSLPTTNATSGRNWTIPVPSTPIGTSVALPAYIAPAGAGQLINVNGVNFEILTYAR